MFVRACVHLCMQECVHAYMHLLGSKVIMGAKVWWPSNSSVLKYHYLTEKKKIGKKVIFR